nr:alpha/beta hydrolase-fold protein [Qipengyuania polymorpha]
MPSPAESGRMVEIASLEAEGLPQQRVTIWLPPEYDALPGRRYPVLYMWDGQNLFDPAQMHYGKAWMVQDVLKGMVARGEAEPHIVVGIWSPPGKDRYRVYVPQFAQDARGELAQDIAGMAGGPIASQLQLDWVADTLVPRIDSEYRTRADADGRTIAGASMGGVMSCYAIIERPDIFGRAGCVSAHLALASPGLAPAHADQVAALWDNYVDAKLGKPDGRRVWMDHGTEKLDSYYAPWQVMVAQDFAERGWQEGEDYTARVYEGAEHDEIFWNARMAEMLRWLWRED